MPEIVEDGCTSIIQISWSDDDYNTFSTPREIFLIEVREVNAPIQLTRLGMARKRAFKIEHIGQDDFRAEAIELEVEIGNFGSS